MADHDHADRLPREVALQPGRGGDVEVVRRLVQEHHVGALQEQLRQHHPRLLPAGERPGLSGEVRRREAEATEDLLDPVVDRVGVLMLQAIPQLVVPPRGPVAVGVVLRLGHLAGRLLHLALEVQERRQARSSYRHQGLVRPEVRLLPEQADPDPRPPEQVAVVRRVQPRHEPHQGRLARPVRADQADPLAGPDLEPEVLEDRVARVLPAQAGRGDEDHRSRARRVGRRSVRIPPRLEDRGPGANGSLR